MTRTLRWTTIAALLAACAQGPSRLDGIAIEKVSVVEEHPGYDPRLMRYGRPLSVIDGTPGRVLVIDLIPADTLLSIVNRVHLEAWHSFEKAGGVAFKSCQSADSFELAQGEYLAGLQSTIDGAILDYQRETFSKIKIANPGGKLRATVELLIFDAAHPSNGGRQWDGIEADTWRTPKSNLCLRFIVFGGRGLSGPPVTTMQSDVLLIPGAEIARLLAAPPLPAP